MTERLTQRSVWGITRMLLIGVLMLSLVAACGSDDDDDDGGNGDTTTTTASTATTATGSADEEETATEADTDDSTSPTSDADDSTSPTSDAVGSPDMAEAMAVGACIQGSMTSDIVSDLRDGNTEGAEEIYRDCLEEELPDAMVQQLDPVIEQAGTCGSEAASDLTDDDIAAIEEGDESKIEEMTTATLECLSTELGIELQ